MLSRAISNKPKDYLRLEQDVKQSMLVSRQDQRLFSKEFFDSKTEKEISTTKLDHLTNPGIVAMMAEMSPAAQSIMTGVHFIS